MVISGRKALVAREKDTLQENKDLMAARMGMEAHFPWCQSGFLRNV